MPLTVFILTATVSYSDMNSTAGTECRLKNIKVRYNKEIPCKKIALAASALFAKPHTMFVLQPARLCRYFELLTYFFKFLTYASREANCCGGRHLHFDFYIQLLFLHTNAIDETAL